MEIEASVENMIFSFQCAHQPKIKSFFDSYGKSFQPAENTTNES